MWITTAVYAGIVHTFFLLTGLTRSFIFERLVAIQLGLDHQASMDWENEYSFDVHPDQGNTELANPTKMKSAVSR
jgi:hypothetical protein